MPGTNLGEERAGMGGAEEGRCQQEGQDNAAEETLPYQRQKPRRISARHLTVLGVTTQERIRRLPVLSRCLS